MQLDTYIDEPGGLTGDGPPSMVLEEELRKEPLLDEIDEEERIAKIEAFPEMMGDANRTITDNSEEDVSPKFLPESKKEPIVIGKKNPTSNINAELYQPEKLIRIKITQTQEEPVLTVDGEIKLQVGDIHMLENDTATYLIEAGVAESAIL